MSAIFGNIQGLFIYMDDFLIYSKSQSEHKQIVTEVLKRLHNNGMAISLDKCEWEQKQVEFLGYTVNETGLKPLPKTLEAISKTPVPQKQKDLLGFLGAANFYILYSTILPP